MVNSIKYASYIIVALTIAYVCLTLKDCGSGRQEAGRTVVPADSAFLPVVRREYRPNPLPFSHSSKPVPKLPKGISENDVARVITVLNHTKGTVASIIETKNGDVFSPKQQDSISISVTDYLPPFVEFGLKAGIGGSVDVALKFSPSACVSVLKWYGLVDAPVAVADIYGVGLGIGFKLYHDIYMMPAVRWQYGTLDKSLILNVSYQL